MDLHNHEIVISLILISAKIPDIIGRSGPGRGPFAGELDPWRNPMRFMQLLLLGLVLVGLAAPAAAFWPRAVVAEMGSATW
jgi:hypothetical protein